MIRETWGPSTSICSWLDSFSSTSVCFLQFIHFLPQHFYYFLIIPLLFKDHSVDQDLRFLLGICLLLEEEKEVIKEAGDSLFSHTPPVVAIEAPIPTCIPTYIPTHAPLALDLALAPAFARVLTLGHFRWCPPG